MDILVFSAELPTSLPKGRRSGRRSGARISWRSLLGAIVLASVVGACGGAAPAVQPGRYSGSLPDPSSICASLTEVDYYVPVPLAASTTQTSKTASDFATVNCSYGDLARSPGQSATVSFVIGPAPELSPQGVVKYTIRHVGLSAFRYRRGAMTTVVIRQGAIGVAVASGALVSDLLGLAEESLSAVPESDRI